MRPAARPERVERRVDPDRMPRAIDLAVRLTPEERRVALLVYEEHSALAIAQQLGKSYHTVKHHIENAAMKLDGPGTPRARIRRYVRGLHDQVRQMAAAETPIAEQAA